MAYDVTPMARDDVAAVERHLRAALVDVRPSRLRAALLSAVTGKAARVRPLFCLAVARAASGREASPLAWATAIAIEMIHCGSLVHDDLPCFDDASERRGRPTVHRLYGEPAAVLTGDALIVAAFAQLARVEAPSSFFAELARATGASGGLISGQAMELEESVDVATYHAAKTGALFEIAARLGAATVGSPAAEAFARLGREVGALYQVADDFADVFGSSEAMGKPTGQDAAHGRPSVSASLDRAKALSVLATTTKQVLAAIPPCPGEAELRAFLEAVAFRLVERIKR